MAGKARQGADRADEGVGGYGLHLERAERKQHRVEATLSSRKTGGDVNRLALGDVARFSARNGFDDRRGIPRKEMLEMRCDKLGHSPQIREQKAYRRQNENGPRTMLGQRQKHRSPRYHVLDELDQESFYVRNWAEIPDFLQCVEDTKRKE
ncbi:uncharacterized protein STEHIDRAFT_116203 [Stereum hirsutum FP-91666 SS1]|uniref:Uncharacterized protein n=1 Tax=Stereum hirsutum (strain FP-91666) TaxID=721885 RepID=R7S0C7_STEHR|nr:uncharacterized protein STEHIDRAFT_116203 [Stereum hirsutum FP-91666 SS1]EIM80017.1 hypothetical protein STEHIDRAFT_116203 [Stereum hirsutum FP-91666 SS1]